MPRTSPKFAPLWDAGAVVETRTGLSIPFDNGYQHIRQLQGGCLHIQISQLDAPDYFSYAIENQVTENLQWEQEEQTLEITAQGTFFLDMESGHWQWNMAPHELLQSEPGLGFGFLGLETIATFHLEANQHFFGLGEKTGGLNRRGSAFTNWNTDAFAYNESRDPLYVSIPFYLSVNQGVCYGVLVDNTCRTRFNFGASNKRMVQIVASSAPMNLILIPGPGPDGVLKRYHQLTGTMPMPPKWALGLHQCRYSYYPDHELMAVAHSFRNRNIPCDVLYLDIHYMDAYKVFTVDKKRFPDLKKMCRQLSDLGFHVVPIQDPGVKAELGYDPYDTGLQQDLFVKYPDGQNWIAGVWPGDCAFPDFTDARARDWWTQKTRAWVSETGVGGLWNDMNEPATWGQDVPDMLEFSMEGRGGSHLEAHNVYGQLMARSTAEGLKLAHSGQRTFVLTRAGYAGIHRYAAVWSGDNVSNEEHYFLGIRLVLSMAMSGVAFSGPDVGGFVGDAGKNLFVRWLSVASFFPFFRLHSMIDSRDNEPWSYGELAEAIAGNYIRLRYKLLPTLYSAFKESSVSGKTVLKPYFWEKPFFEFESAFQHQFFWCDRVLVVPAASEQAAVWADLPDGNWYHLFTGQKMEGNQALWLSAPLETLPVLVKEGSVLVTRMPGAHSLDPVGGDHQIHVFYGLGQSSFYFYDDDGISENPSDENLCEAEIRFVGQEDVNELTIQRISGKKEWGFTSLYLWHFPANSRILVNGVETKSEPSGFVWLESLPNFDPFEDKSRQYFSRCQRIALV